MKPGELERHLRRLVEVARHARERLSAAQDGLIALRRDAASLAVSPPGSDGESGEPGGSRDAHEHQRRDRGESTSDRSRREADSK